MAESEPGAEMNAAPKAPRPPRRAMRRRLVAVALVLAAITGIVLALWPTRPEFQPQSVKLADGSILQLAAVTYGSVHRVQLLENAPGVLRETFLQGPCHAADILQIPSDT